jgi:ribonuclease PH
MAGDSLQDQARELKSSLSLKRSDGRTPGEARPFEIISDFNMHAEGSVLVKSGRTQVICTASLEERVPPFRRGTGKGWVTAEYGMLPRATNTRTTREATAGKASGRTAEIQRLIGRSLRAVVELDAIGENTIWIDCDVIQADGSTRTAAITGGFVALVMALRKLGARQKFRRPPVTQHVAAVSVGLIEEQPFLDLDYGEDAGADVDLNVVMTDSLQIIEIQGTAEEVPFQRPLLERMLDFSESGITQRVAVQREVLGNRLV